MADKQALFHRLVGIADHRLERRDHVADHIFRRVVQKDREPQPVVDRALLARQRIDQQRVLRDRKDMRAVGLAVPARHPRDAMRDVLDLDIERGGVEQVEPSPRQHALPGARLAAGLETGRRPLRRHVLRPSFAQAACRWHVTR